MQETTIIDFKESITSSFTDGYGAGIVRLALGLHNTYGGLIVFGVVDRTPTPAPLREIFNIEALIRFLSGATGVQIECAIRRYSTAASGSDLPIQVVLVPRRNNSKPVRLARQLGTYLPGTLWVRDRHEVLGASSGHLPLIYGDRAGFLGQLSEPDNPVHPSNLAVDDGRVRRSRRSYDPPLGLALLQ